MTANRVVLITGASSGMGKDFAKTLLAQGFTVYAAARRISLMRDIEALGATLLKMDITKEEDVQAAISQIQEDNNGVDILINNAGFGLYGAVEDTGIDDARYQFEVNLFGLARLTQLVIPYMREKRAGTIINISSIGGKIYTPLGSWYIATKHAVEGWSDCLRIELKQFGINVVIVEPGAIETEFIDVMLDPMLERSGQGAYQSMAKKLAALTKTSNVKSGGASSPEVITHLINKAIHSKKPKTRYAAGKYATALPFIRKWFGDKIYDRMVLSLVKQ